MAAVERLGAWVEKHCRDARGAGGFTAGYGGWEPSPTRLGYKATEHNIDLYAALARLHLLTSDPRWGAASKLARRFVDAMWDGEEGKFWTVTGGDGVTINQEVIPQDAQAWAVLAEKGANPFWLGNPSR